jgi:hypothetical protein
MDGCTCRSCTHALARCMAAVLIVWGVVVGVLWLTHGAAAVDHHDCPFVLLLHSCAHASVGPAPSCCTLQGPFHSLSVCTATTTTMAARASLPPVPAATSPGGYYTQTFRDFLKGVFRSATQRSCKVATPRLSNSAITTADVGGDADVDVDGVKKMSERGANDSPASYASSEGCDGAADDDADDRPLALSPSDRFATSPAVAGSSRLPPWSAAVATALLCTIATALLAYTAVCKPDVPDAPLSRFTDVYVVGRFTVPATGFVVAPTASVGHPSSPVQFAAAPSPATAAAPPSVNASTLKAAVETVVNEPQDDVSIIMDDVTTVDEPTPRASDAMPCVPITHTVVHRGYDVRIVTRPYVRVHAFPRRRTFDVTLPVASRKRVAPLPNTCGPFPDVVVVLPRIENGTCLPRAPKASPLVPSSPATETATTAVAAVAAEAEPLAVSNAAVPLTVSTAAATMAVVGAKLELAIYLYGAALCLLSATLLISELAMLLRSPPSTTMPSPRVDTPREAATTEAATVPVSAVATAAVTATPAALLGAASDSAFQNAYIANANDDDFGFEGVANDADDDDVGGADDGSAADMGGSDAGNDAGADSGDDCTPPGAEPVTPARGARRGARATARHVQFTAETATEASTKASAPRRQPARRASMERGSFVAVHISHQVRKK